MGKEIPSTAVSPRSPGGSGIAPGVRAPLRGDRSVHIPDPRVRDRSDPCGWGFLLVDGYREARGAVGVDRRRRGVAPAVARHLLSGRDNGPAFSRSGTMGAE